MERKEDTQESKTKDVEQKSSGDSAEETTDSKNKQDIEEAENVPHKKHKKHRKKSYDKDVEKDLDIMKKDKDFETRNVEEKNKMPETEILD